MNTMAMLQRDEVNKINSGVIHLNLAHLKLYSY